MTFDPDFIYGCILGALWCVAVLALMMWPGVFIRWVDAFKRTGARNDR